MITRDIAYIGVDDTDLDLFESQYIIPNGISYNSYLIKDDSMAARPTISWCSIWSPTTLVASPKFLRSTPQSKS